MQYDVRDMFPEYLICKFEKITDALVPYLHILLTIVRRAFNIFAPQPVYKDLLP